jgi:hypothetical protein
MQEERVNFETVAVYRRREIGWENEEDSSISQNSEAHTHRIRRKMTIDHTLHALA